MEGKEQYFIGEVGTKPRETLQVQNKIGGINTEDEKLKKKKKKLLSFLSGIF